MKTIEVKNAKERNSDSYTPPVQSADTLFHFVEKLEYLLPAIERFALVPRYCTEDVDYLQIGYRKLAYPMLCFCDINLHKMREHIHFYGGDGYGIAFSKKWGISKAIQPIQYINPDSPLRKDFSVAFTDSLKSNTDDSAQNFLLSQMLFYKPIQGTMERNGKSIQKNFTDECEWRFIPDVNGTDYPQVIPENDLFSKIEWNKAMLARERCWLKFESEDIKYIIVKSRVDFQQLVEVLGKKSLSSIDMMSIISKVIVWDDAKGDF